MKKKYKEIISYRIYYFLLLLLGFYILPGCKSKNSKREYTIGFSQCVGSDQWRKTMLEEMKRELSFHPELKLIYTNAENSSATQVQQVRSMLRNKIDLLIISPNEARPLTPIVEEAFSQGIPVIVIDRKTSSSLYTAYVGADNFEIGKIAGAYLVNKLDEKGSILEVMGLSGSSPTIERQRGFYHALKNYPNIRIVKQVYGNWLINEAENEVNKIGVSSKQIDAVFAHNDQMALGSYRALKRHNPTNKIKIIGVDALPDNGLKYVANNIIDASMLYPTGGKEAIRTAFSILNKEHFDKENILKTVVIDSSNVQLMKMQSDKITSQYRDIGRQQGRLKEQEKIFNNQQILLNVLVISLVLAIVFAGVAFYSLNENWKSNKRLESKNQEIQQQQNQLLEMSAETKRASEAKFNFFTNISHEFRTPLTLILVPLEELVADTKLPLTVKQHLRLINKNVIRLLRMVNQLIDFRKIEYDKMKIRASENDLIAFTTEILDSFKNIASKRNIDMRLNSTEKKPMVWFDVNMFDKVLFNLLSNAFKFTNDNGRILITIQKDEEKKEIEIKVEDNGVGMTEESVLHAFELFYQGESYQSKGSGLGLSLSKEIIQLHKGVIDVSSKKWKGTSFCIRLPLGDAHLQEEEKLAKTPEININYDNIKLYTSDLDQDPSKEDHELAFENIKEQSLLIIEDNSDMLDFLKQKLANEYEIFTASTGNGGLHEAFERVPDLIISDVVLPGQSGTDLARVLKNDVRTSHIPIILLTARGSSEQQLEGIKTLADAYITKPFNLQHLTETIKNLLDNRNLLKSHYTSEYQGEGKIPVSKKLDKKFLNDFAGIVESNLGNENFNVDVISKSIGISRVQLYRKVKALLECNITDYILNRRLQKAKYLLMNEDLSISEITYQVGFSSATYFSTVFKSKYNCTPSEFKRKKDTS